MQKRLILGIGVLLGSCLSTAAQTHRAQFVLSREPSTPLVMVVQTMPAQLPPALLPPVEPVEKTLVGFTALLALAETPDRGLRRFFSVEVVKTAFATESRVPILQLPGGWLQLGGYASTHNLGNVRFGPSALGHPGVWIPRSAWAYGISLRFRLGGDAQAEGRADGWPRLAWLIGPGRGGRT